MQDPGLDRHARESEWAALEPLVEDSPAEALPELDRLIERMLVEEGYPIDDAETVTDEGIDPEVLASFRAAREITERVDRGEDVGPGDVGEAVRLYRELYEHLVARAADTA